MQWRYVKGTHPWQDPRNLHCNGRLKVIMSQKGETSDQHVNDAHVTTDNTIETLNFSLRDFSAQHSDSLTRNSVINVDSAWAVMTFCPYSFVSLKILRQVKHKICAFWILRTITASRYCSICPIYTRIFVRLCS